MFDVVNVQFRCNCFPQMFEIVKEDDAILVLNFFENAIFCFSILLPFLLHYNSNFFQIPSLSVTRYSSVINLYLSSFLKVLSRLVVCTFFAEAQTFWTKLLLRQPAANDVNDDCSPENTRMYNVFWFMYEAKTNFYCSNEINLPLLLTEMFLLLLNFQFTWLFSKKLPVRAVSVIFFYLYADEQEKTRSSCHWQLTFPPWPRGKGNCLRDCPHRFWVVRGQVKSN